MLSFQNDEQEKFRKLLHKKFEETKQRNPRVSLRSYAQRLGVSSGGFSEILNGKRSISSKFFKKIAPNLALTEDEIKELNLPSHAGKNEEDFANLTIEKFSVISDGLHYAILGLVKTSTFQSKIEWMAKRLRKNKKETTQAIERLLKLDMLIKNDEHYETTGKSFRSPDNISSMALKNHHKQALNEAEDSLFRDPVETRDFTTLTFAFNSNKIEQVRESIRKFREEIMQHVDQGHSDEVYKMNIQFFPLTDFEDKETEK